MSNKVRALHAHAPAPAALDTPTDLNEFVVPIDMLRELMEDNKAMMANMRKAHEICDEHDDVATASLLEVFIDGAERRNWFLSN